jgi:Ser/Thr protein kinase RdoA (MazF antagonist)
MKSGLANEAVGFWPLKVKTLALAAHRENAVYRVEAEEGVFALRLHRHGYRSDSELESELQMMAMLERKCVRVPQPVQTHAGGWLAHLKGTQVSLLRWMKGKPLGETGVPLVLDNRLATFRSMGHLIAQMHDAFDQWRLPEGFVRQRWDVEGLFGEQPQWGRFWDNPLLLEDQKTKLLVVRERLQNLFAQRTFDMGLIHADMVSENILVDGDQLTVIDFDDSGFGFRLQDLATALVKHQAEPDFAELRAALVAGYRETRSVEESDIDLFLFIRHLTYLGWIVPRMENAGGEMRARSLVAQAMSRAEAFLSSGP